MSGIDSLLRRVVSNRRRHRRRHITYEVDLKNERNQVVFRGRTADISRSGARLCGLPTNDGATEGQRVLVEVTVPPRDPSGPMQRLSLPACIIRIEETVDSFAVAVTFDRELAE
jgi:hypothetical protein